MKKFKRATGFLAMLALSALFAGCAGMSVNPNGTVTMPTRAQLAAACAQEEAAHKKWPERVNCNALYAIDTACKVAAIAQVSQPLIMTVAPVEGSIMRAPVAISVAVCSQQGFYTVSQ